MSHLTPNTTSAAAKLLRTLTSTLRNPSAARFPSEAFSTATGENSDRLLTTLISLLIPATPAPTLNNALQTLFNLSNTLPPSHLAPSWRTLCQRVLTLSKQAPHPRTLITLASLIIASIPLSTLGTEQRSVVAAIAQQSLQHSQTTLLAYPAESLCVIHAVIHAAPRELRAQALDERLQILYSNPKPQVRSLAAMVSTRLVTCVAEKQQQDLFSERLAYIQEQVADITALLDAFTTGRYNGNMAEKSPQEVCDHLDGVCKLLVHLLDLPLRETFPLGQVLNALCAGVWERVIDPYAVVEGVKITHDDLLIVIPQVQRLCGQTITDITERFHKAALQMFVKDVGKVFEMQLSKLLLRSREDDGLTCVVERGNIYATIGRLVTAFGTGFLDFIVPHFQELFEIDIALHRKCLAGENVLKVDHASSIPSSGKSRKRRRQNGRRDATVGGHVVTKESMESLASVYGKETSRSVGGTIDVALDVITRMFDCRGLLTKAVIQHLQRLEDILLEFLDGRRLSPVLFRAVTSAALSGGSKRMAGEASPLLVPLARVSVTAALDTSLSSETRNVALAARAGCEVIIHPRGPPYITESRMYPTIVGNASSGLEKLAAKKDSSKSLEKSTSQQNGSLRDQGDAVIADEKEMMADVQQGIPSEEAGEKGGKKAINRAPSNDLMEVEDAAEIQPILSNAKPDLPEESKSLGGDLCEIAPLKVAETGKLPANSDKRGAYELQHPATVEHTTTIAGHRNSSTADKEAKKLLDMRVENTKESLKQASDDPAVTEGAKMASREEDRNRPEENQTSYAHQRVSPADPEGAEEQDSEKEDQALIASLVFESSDEE